MEVRILGPTEVIDGGASVPLPKGRARSLLGVLVMSAGEVVSTDRLIDELWGESAPPTVDTALQGLVHKLRGCLEPQRASGERPEILLTRPPGYLLDLAPEQIDSSRFRRMIAEASDAAPENAAELLRRALALWRGPALVDFRYEPFAQSEIVELEELRLTAVEKRIETDLVLGRHQEVVAELERLAAEHPLREGVHSLLMLALYRSGRQADALRVYADLRSTLLEQMGLDPGPSLQELDELILRQDPTLDPEVVTSLEPVTDGEGWIPEERRFVTVLAVDVSTETDRGDTPDAEVSQRVLDRFFRKATAVVTGHGGSVEGTVGHTLVGIFGLPTADEDDALRAVRAAVDLRHLLAATNTELSESGFQLRAHAGVDTGEVIVGESTVSPSGAPVRGATQLYRAAQIGEILMGQATRLLVGKAALSEHRKVDLGDGQDRAAWRVLDLASRVSALPLTLRAPLVGREAELGELRAAYERVVAEGRPLRLTTLGEPGIGKSRLARELASMVEAEALVLTGHCPAHGEGHTFSPFREVAEAAAGAIETGALLDLLRGVSDADEIARHVMAVTESTEREGSPGVLFPMIRRFFEVLTEDRPVVMILEALHWARPTFLDLVEYLTETLQAPLLLVCLARPELLEEHADWVEGDRTSSLLLGPLDAAESRRLAANRLAGRMVPDEVLTRVLETAQGNPLFVEQLVVNIGEEGDFSIPATVQALLAARIDRLGPAERDLVRFASVLGHRFPVAALVSLLPEPARPHVSRHLRTLERKDLMVRGITEQGECGFRHVLIRQAAYRSMTMQTRADLHERAADWLEAEAGAGRDSEETGGHHLERAHEYRRELGFIDEHTQRLAVRAGEKLAGAGLRVFATRLDAAGAESLLGRARRLLPHEHPSQWEVNFRLAEAHETMGRHHQAETVLSDLLARESEPSDRRLVLELERVRVRFATGPDPMTLEEIVDLATTALTDYEARGDEAGMAQALFMLGEVSRRRGRIAEMEEIVLQELGYADQSDSGREQLGARRMLATALEIGSKPVPHCIEECEVLAFWRGKRNAAVMPVLAHLYAMNGQFDRAREMVARAEIIFKERARARRPLTLLHKRRAEVEILADDLATAEAELRQALQLDLDMEIREEASEAAALLARVLFVKGYPDEAAEMADLSRNQAPSQSVARQALWRSIRALTLASRDQGQDAIRLAEAAVDMVPVEMLNLRADIHIDLGIVLSSLGFREAGLDALDEAINLYGRKGNLAAASRARSLMAVGD